MISLQTGFAAQITITASTNAMTANTASAAFPRPQPRRSNALTGGSSPRIITADKAIDSSASCTRYVSTSAKKIPTALTTVGTETTTSTVRGASGWSLLVCTGV